MRTSFFALMSLELVACRRAAPTITHDPPPAVVDAGPSVAEDPWLINGKVVDLTTFKVVHRLTKVLPLSERQTHGIGWLVVPHGTVEGYELATGKRLVTTTARCGSLTTWGERVVCRQDASVFILDKNGGQKTLEIAGTGRTFVPLATKLLVHRFSGEIDLYGEDGAHLASHPVMGTFANVFEDGDGYCLVDQVIECRKPDGTRRFRTEIKLPLPSASMMSFSTNFSATEEVISGIAGGSSATVVVRIRDGKTIGKATPAAGVLVLREGSAYALLRSGASNLELLDLEGKVRWAVPSKRHPTDAFATNDAILLVEDGTITALNLDDGALRWERAVEHTGGVAFERYAFLRKNLIFIREHTDVSSRLQLVDIKTGEIRFTDEMRPQ